MALQNESYSRLFVVPETAEQRWKELNTNGAQRGEEGERKKVKEG
jgi:hypothetical protein